MPDYDQSKRLALLIGNTDYKDPGLNPLVTPVEDVKDLQRLLQNPAIGAFEVRLLINKPEATIRREIARFFKAGEKKDLLLLYFSGHGIKENDGLYLAVKDTDKSLPSATAIPASFIKYEMDNCYSQRLIIILDCCYSGAFVGAKSGAEVGTKDQFLGQGYGRIMLTASDSIQRAWEDQPGDGSVANSVFTRYLVEALEKGRADLDGDGDGWITPDDVYDYVYRQVITNHPGRQTPQKFTEKGTGDIYLVRSLVGPQPGPMPVEPAKPIPVTPTPAADPSPVQNKPPERNKPMPDSGGAHISVGGNQPGVIALGSAKDVTVTNITGDIGDHSAIGPGATVTHTVSTSSTAEPTVDDFKQLLVEIQQKLAEITQEQELLEQISAAAPHLAVGAEAEIEKAAEQAKTEADLKPEQATAMEESIKAAGSLLSGILDGAKTAAEKVDAVGEAVKPLVAKLEPLVGLLGTAALMVARVWLAKG